MSCPDLDPILDLGLGVPPAVREHVAACADCSAELRTAMAVAAGFAEMRAEAAPDHVVAAALATAHALPKASKPGQRARRATSSSRATAPSRAPAASRALSTRRAAVGAALAAAALVLSVWLVGVPAPESEEPVASAVTARSPMPSAPRPSPLPPSTAVPAPSPVPVTMGADDSAPFAELRPVPAGRASEPALPDAPPDTFPSELVAADSLSAPSPPDPVAVMPDVTLPDSVAAARDGALLALGLVADAQVRARRSVARELGRIGDTVVDAAATPHSLTP